MPEDDEPETDAERVVRAAIFQGLTLAQSYNNSFGHYKGIEKIDGMKFYHCPDGSSIGTRRMPKTPGWQYEHTRDVHRNFYLDIWCTPPR